MTVKEYNICVTQFADRIYRFVARQIAHTADAEDIVQNAFIVLWQKREAVDFDKARSFLFTVSYRNMVSLFRQKKNIMPIDDLTNFAQTPSSSEFDLQDMLHKGLLQLSDIQRTVLLLRDYEGYTYSDIAQITELTESQVKVYIFRARKKLVAFCKAAEILPEHYT